MEVETQDHQFEVAFLMPTEEIHDQLPTIEDWPIRSELKRGWQAAMDPADRARW